MESGVGNHYGSGKSGGGNGGLFCDTCELGAPWGAPHHGPPHQLPSPFFHLNNPAADSIPFSSATSLPFSPHHHNLHTIAQAGDAHHLTCLKLGKRQYYEEGRASDPPAASGGLKRERVATAVPRGSSSAAAAATASPPSSSSAMVVPRCQVEGCNLALVDAKDYHRRHKVCEIHSKAPKVVVLGIEQRFCQQCSRFHVISEFDDSKRSCRRRLAGHNERRRKSSAESVIRNPSPLDGTAVGSGMPYLSPSNAAGHALSLLSPKASSSWASSDLSSQSSAALRELIAENRAAILAGQLLLDRGTWHGASPGAQVVFSIAPQQQQQQPLPLTLPPQLEDGWDHLRTPGAQVTLDLMQTPSSSIEILSGRSRSKEGDEECCDIWKSLEGTHVV